MEQWLPLFQILLDSPSPEGEASFWLLEQHHELHSPATSAFLSLLLSPSPLHSLSSLTASPSSSNPLIWFQTLPFSIQTRILSLLAAESRRFCPRRLQSLACHIMNSDLPFSADHPAFWVRRAARNLFDALPGSVLESEQRASENEFDSLPHWLENVAKTNTPLLPWLPVNVSHLQKAAAFEFAKKSRSKELVSKNGKIKPLSESEDNDNSPPPLLSQSIQKANALKAELLAIDCTADSLHLADKIRQLCLESGVGNELKVLELIEPWEATDETLSVLLLHLVNDGGLFSKSWPSYVLCSMALPKLLTLQSPASRALLSATICFCKQHQTAAVEGLIFPLMLHKEGINAMLCDVLVMLIKECLHPSHVSAFCQRLLCGEGKGRKLVFLPGHQGLISEQVVWTESSFHLFQNIMNLEVYFTPDTNDKLVSVIDEMASKFSNSLKFGNFLLCFVTKCSYAVNAYKVQLRDATEKTSTLVTRSILSRLNA
ncbi:hypothetical protein KFK09_003634 [Dendrobium nobile]|uniref:Fanconi Anaemia group E protein C-terminal domain-containing protein n=1 Tax=Dendrobium nobile TaxID=94219 RepID=A0A8T3C411_DENNO|nr:hypothetical protein KFK09_003634 [Dendrobium nobile]